MGKHKNRKIRPVIVEGDIAYVTLTQGFVAKIDAIDVNIVDGSNWCASVQGRAVYAVTNIDLGNDKRTTVRMHRLIMQPSPNTEIDHVSGDGLDNRRVNLREVTSAENSQNQGVRVNNASGFKGVTWHNGTSKWRAQIITNGVYSHLGLFTNQLDEMDVFISGLEG